MSVVTRIGLTPRRQGQLVRVLQAVMVGILLLGIWQFNMGVIMNAAVGLGVTFLPALLRRTSHRV